MDKTLDNPKVQQIFHTARSLVMRFGIKKVTVEEICSEAGVSKMTFYKYFRNKTDLALFILDRMIDDSMRRYNEIKERNIPYPEKVRLWIGLKMEQVNDLSQEFMDDIFSMNFPEIKAYYDKMARENIAVILNDFIEAQKRGDLREDVKPEFILYFFNHMFRMVDDRELIKFYKSPGELIGELTNFFFYGILPRGGKQNLDGEK